MARRRTAKQIRASRSNLIKARRARKLVNVYHYTNPKSAQKIVGQQKFKTHSGIRAPGNVKNHVYVTRRRSNFYKNEFRPLGRKSSVVTFKVQQRHLKRDKNDATFLPYVAKYGSKHKPAYAYTVNKAVLKGTKIRSL